MRDERRRSFFVLVEKSEGACVAGTGRGLRPNSGFQCRMKRLVVGVGRRLGFGVGRRLVVGVGRRSG